MFRKIYILLIALFCFQNAFSEPVKNAPQELGEILFVTSYNVDNNYSNTFIEDMMEEYRQMGGSRKVSIEAMNCHSLDAVKYWMVHMNEILERHPRASAVVLYGLEAWVSYFSLTQKEYRQLPVICVGGQRWAAGIVGGDVPAVHIEPEQHLESYDVLDMIKGFNVKACYYYEYDMDADMTLLRNFFPQVDNLAIISDNSYSGLSNRNVLSNYMKRTYPQMPVKFIDGLHLDLDGATEEIQKLSEHSAIFFCMWKYDKFGAIKTNHDHRLFHLLTDEKNIPVLSLTGSGFGSWALGGSHPDYNWNNGRRKPAEFVYNALDLKITDEEPYFYAVPNRLRMDYRVMQRFNILEGDLPSGTVVINKDQLTILTLLDQFKWTILISILALLAVTACLVLSIVYSLHLRKLRSRLERAKANAESADSQKSIFIQNISHEIRTSFNAIQGFTQLITNESVELDKDGKEKLVKGIENNMNIVTDQLEAVKLLAKLDQGEPMPEPEEVSMDDVYNLALSQARCYIPKAVKVELSIPENIVIRSVKSDLVQILKQLLSNAGKFTKSGQVTVGIMQNLDKSRLTISVTDNGPGIPVEEAERIFERFVKLDGYVEGTGLGLTIARLLANRLGGTVKVDTSFMNGSRLVVTLPLKHEALFKH